MGIDGDREDCRSCDRLQNKLDAALLQSYESAAKFLRAEAKKIPRGEGNVEKGFSSTYNALVFAAQVLEDAIEKLMEKRKDEKVPICDKEYASIDDTYSYCGLEFGHNGPCGRG